MRRVRAGPPRRFGMGPPYSDLRQSSPHTPMRDVSMHSGVIKRMFRPKELTLEANLPWRPSWSSRLVFLNVRRPDRANTRIDRRRSGERRQHKSGTHRRLQHTSAGVQRVTLSSFLPAHFACMIAAGTSIAQLRHAAKRHMQCTGTSFRLRSGLFA